MVDLIKTIYHLLVAIFSLLYFRFPGHRLTVIGVTGTDGKTTTTTLIYEILKKAGYKTSMITSVHAVIAGREYDTGFHVTTPNAWWVQKYLREAVDHGDKFMVLETTSHALTQFRVFGIPFRYAALTNITPEHLDWHKTFDAYVFAKLRLLRAANTVILNRDDADVYNRIIPYLRNKKLITYGIVCDAKVTPKTYPFKTLLPGDFNQYNCLAAISVTSAIGIDKKIIQTVLRDFQGVSGRMELIQKKPFMVIVDFAHTPNAIDVVLKTVRKLTKKRLIHIFGSAGLRDHSKRPMMGEASGRYADIIILTEEDYRTEKLDEILDQIQLGIPAGREIHRVADRREAIAFALNTAKSGDLVIFTGKGHEQSLCRGTTEYPWDDREEVRKALKRIHHS